MFVCSICQIVVFLRNSYFNLEYHCSSLDSKQSKSKQIHTKSLELLRFHGCSSVFACQSARTPTNQPEAHTKNNTKYETILFFVCYCRIGSCEIVGIYSTFTSKKHMLNITCDSPLIVCRVYTPPLFSLHLFLFFFFFFLISFFFARVLCMSRAYYRSLNKNISTDYIILVDFLIFHTVKRCCVDFLCSVSLSFVHCSIRRSFACGCYLCVRFRFCLDWIPSV